MGALKMTHSREALAAYDLEKPVIDRLFERCETNADVEFASRIEKLAANLVRVAFYLDTHDRNNMGHCMSASVDFIRQCVANAK